MVSAVILAKNEEKNIAECLKSLQWCDEIIVIDDESGDTTVDVARQYGAKVYTRKLNNDFASQRNFGLGMTRGDWVLFVDADEHVTLSLCGEIKRVIGESGNRVTGYFVKRTDVMWGRELKYGETGSIKLLRLARKGKGRWKRKVHEIWEISGKTKVLSSPLLHFPHHGLKDFIAAVDYYSTLDAEWKRSVGIRSSLLKIWLWPKAKFLQNWVLRLGFLDGTPGLLVALMMSLHSFLSWSKLWLSQKK